MSEPINYETFKEELIEPVLIAYAHLADSHTELRKENEQLAAVIEAVRLAISSPFWLSIGSINNVAEVRIPKETYNKILATLGTGAATHDAVKEAARAVNEYFKRIRNDNNLHADLYDLLNEMSAAIEGEKR